MSLGLVGFDKHILAQVKKIHLVCLLPFKVIKAKPSSDSVVSTFSLVLWCISLLAQIRNVLIFEIPISKVKRDYLL